MLLRTDSGAVPTGLPAASDGRAPQAGTRVEPAEQPPMTAFQKILADFQDRVRRLNEIERYARRRRRKPWGDAALTLCARAAVLRGDRAWRDFAAMCVEWELDRSCPWPPTPRTVARFGGLKAVYARIARGGLLMEDRIGVWNGGFFRGLRLSGALKPCGGRQWQVWEKGHPELVRDMEGMSVSNRMEKAAGRNGVRRLRRCPASFLPAEPPSGASVLAGVFAGASMRRTADGDWLELPESDGIVGLLEDWRLVRRPGRTFRGGRTLLVPPFYGPLFADFLPPGSMARLLAVRRPAMCPLLPAIYWDLVLVRGHMPVIPFTGALPFSCSMRTFRRRGWRRDELHRTAVGMGINVVDPRLKDLMEAWFEARMATRGKAKVETAADPAHPVIAAPGIAPGMVRIAPGTEIPPAGVPS